MAKESGSYVGLARKWRPKTFDDVVGQPQAVDQLRLDVASNRVKHAYLFSGPRGVGKTSMARILAKAMNCKSGPTPTPCGTCDRCRAITDGFDVDTVEIDAATYTKVENIRELQEGFNRAPLGGLWKIYIIDEVHMLSDSAFNALLKSLEEPPSRVIFVLATTNPEKIPETVLSRCTRIQFRRIAPEDVVRQLGMILDTEARVRVREGERDAILEAIAMSSEGGLRDAEVALDQLISLGEKEITLEHVQQLLGLVESTMLEDCVRAMLERDTATLLFLVHSLVERGRDIQRFVKTLLHYLRDLLVLRVAQSGEAAETLGVLQSRAGFEKMRELAHRVPPPFLLNAINQFLVLDERLRGIAPARFLLEFTFLKMAEADRAVDLDALTRALTRGGGTPPAQAASRQGTPNTGREGGQTPRSGGGSRGPGGAPGGSHGPGGPGGAPGPGPSTPPGGSPDRWSAPSTDHDPTRNAAAEVPAPAPAPAPAPSSALPAAPPPTQTPPPPSPSLSPTPAAGIVAPPASAPPLGFSVAESTAPQTPPPDFSWTEELGIEPVGTDDGARFWKSLHDQLRQRFIQIAMALQSAALLEIGEGTLRIGLSADAEGELARMLLKRPDKKRDLDAVASALAGRPMGVRLDTMTAEYGESPSNFETPFPADASADGETLAENAENLSLPETPLPGSPFTPAYFGPEGSEAGTMESGEDYGAMPDWARDAGIPPSQFHKVSFEEALRRYPELRAAVDLVHRSLKAKPQYYNGRPLF